jgi:hypothetical protein
MRTLVFALLLFVPCLAVAQAFDSPMAPITSKGSYPAIEFMSASESSALPSAATTNDPSPDAPQAQSLRVVVYRSEIYQSLVVETLTTGLEGCCSTVAAARSVDLASFAEHFGFKGELSGFVFAGWSSPSSFRFTYRGQPFHATVINGVRIRIDRGMGANNSFKPKPLRGSA